MQWRTVGWFLIVMSIFNGTFFTLDLTHGYEKGSFRRVRHLSVEQPLGGLILCGGLLVVGIWLVKKDEY
jgi:uncharacterized membrane protein YgdD (TMEM256/DUF423 family)